MHHANVFTTVFRLDSYPQNSSEKWHRLKWTRSMEKKTELGTKTTPKSGYQSKRKEILFLLIGSYRHKSLLHQHAQVLGNQNSSFLRIKQQHNHDNNNNNNNNSLRDRRNSTAPVGLVGSPNWRMIRTNMTRFRFLATNTLKAQMNCQLWKNKSETFDIGKLFLDRTSPLKGIF